MKRTLSLLALCFISAMWTATAARADVEMCNKTDGLLQIAIAHPITHPYATNQIRGWIRIHPRECETMVAADGNVSFPLYYVMVQEDMSIYQPAGVRAEYPFCIRLAAFVRRGSWAKLQGNCPSGYALQDFYLYNVRSGNLTIDIND